jgi:hypothetical protein
MNRLPLDWNRLDKFRFSAVALCAFAWFMFIVLAVWTGHRVTPLSPCERLLLTGTERRSLRFVTVDSAATVKARIIKRTTATSLNRSLNSELVVVIV